MSFLDVNWPICDWDDDDDEFLKKPWVYYCWEYKQKKCLIFYKKEVKEKLIFNLNYTSSQHQNTVNGQLLGYMRNLTYQLKKCLDSIRYMCNLSIKNKKKEKKV